MGRASIVFGLRHRPARARRWAAIVAAVLVCGAGNWIGPAVADEIKPPDPEDVELTTRDGVRLMATFYASPLEKEKRKDAVPVILLHEVNGNRGTFAGLARTLQAEGHAVIGPDLRGHGQSAAGVGRPGALRAEDYAAMVAPGGDLETIKRFLMARNNAGELNIEKLCLVGVEESAVLAINWAALDWSWAVLATGKQGQDVKALVLISPEWSIHGMMRINEALAEPSVRQALSMLIVVGQKSARPLQEAKRLHHSLLRYHPAPPDEEAEKQMLFFRTPETKLQGMRLLNEKSLAIDELVVKFIELRLVDQTMPWAHRQSALK
jgi:pimeloyl-ACP methyl ester carboxylesterase